MKSIHFDNLLSKWYYLPVLGLVVLLLGSYFLFREHEDAYIFYLFSTLISVILISRNFWYKAYVQYNKSRILMRINTSSQISLEFGSITHIKHEAEKLSLTENAKIHQIDIEDVQPADVQKLVNLIVRYSEAFYEDARQVAYYE
ncbi:hypothetical protein [Psychroflexus salis]|uniref:Uncharacterized protein n=1 Tax=Psychroflexus salis TaxID=1526574 RepID=A0A916ZM62_9FLAO|nr:hypothetical protein [Psychroflexus salis]GGE04503.1 hypothetical protein GCM10010831_02590 [Psychroflexus salis]